MPGLVPFSCEIGANGAAAVTVAGRDISDEVAGARLDWAVGQPPVLTLVEMVEGKITGEGIVRIGVDPGDQREAVSAFLHNLNGRDLEEQALGRMGNMSNIGFGEAVLEVLREAVGVASQS